MILLSDRWRHLHMLICTSIYVGNFDCSEVTLNATSGKAAVEGAEVVAARMLTASHSKIQLEPLLTEKVKAKLQVSLNAKS